ncbi:hypothetical protein C8J57DRAFT_1268067 [Mycena rebaudengoi]|nr:hypothetical protein C8J57DRAFT_1268067 [Mycena rebaudengoi]
MSTQYKPRPPRPSVLELFDPLSGRDANSPESDKENSLPDFFTQSCLKQQSPVRLTRRLVEVGDVTAEFDEGDSDEADEVEGGDDEDDTVGWYPPSTPRTPLADIAFDRELTPMRSKMYRRNAVASITAAPTSPNSAINTADGSGGIPGSSHIAPSVIVCSPDESPTNSLGEADALSASLATLSLATPTGSLITDTTMAFPTPSEASYSLHVPTLQPHSTSTPQYMDRSSVDLQSSFALHLHSPEISFDLLNDRISFLGLGESFDMESGLESITEEEEVTANEPDFLKLDNATNSHLFPANIAPAEEQEILPNSRPAVSTHSEVSLETSSPVRTPSPLTPCVSSPPTPPRAPVFVPELVPSQLLPSPPSSAPEPPPLVPALKIAKRKHLETTAIPNTLSTTHAKAQSLLPSDPTPLPDAPVATRSGPVRIVPVATSVTSRMGTTDGPRRVPILSGEKEKPASSTGSQKPANTVSGPRRVPLCPASAPAPAPAPAPVPMKAPSQIPAASGLKRLSRLVPPSASISGLPRAIGGTVSSSSSRLPMPKAKATGSGGTGLPRRRVL